VNLFKEKRHQIAQSYSDITIVAVAKYASLERTQELLDSGVIHIGESKVQDTYQKRDKLTYSPNVRWHMIGHLQTNKSKKAVHIFDSIDSVDSIKLAKELNRHGKSDNKIVQILLQVNIGSDPNKFGFTSKEILDALPIVQTLPNIHVNGLMIVTPKTENIRLVNVFFKESFNLYKSLKKEYPNIKTLSMGMSDDYKIALKNGSTEIRLGKSLFKN
jgi:PLP dependent protein